MATTVEDAGNLQKIRNRPDSIGPTSTRAVYTVPCNTEIASKFIADA